MKTRVIVFLLWLICSILVFFSSLKEQVLISKNSQQTISNLLPQGWGFFTKNPRDPLLEVYKINKNKLEKITLLNFDSKSFYGFSRKARFIGFECSDVCDSFKKIKWNDDVYSNVNKLKKGIVVKYKKKKLKYLKDGTYLFLTYRIVPYAWVKNGQQKFNPVSYIHVNIEGE
jgi:antimicrobial peptide system SdpA family protein